MDTYLDHNATTPPAPEVIDAMVRVQRENWANPSSVHRGGQQARAAVEDARQRVAALLGARPGELIFTSGATESNNLAVRGLMAARPQRRTLITTRLEHSAVREPARRVESQGDRVIWLPVTVDGLVEPAALAAALDEAGGDAALVAIHWINNETGAIQPMQKLGELCRDRSVPLFTDATQAVGKIPLDVSSMPIDALSFTGHKFHGPKGVGGLYVHPRQRLVPQNLGGPHERERRGGTENTPGIVGLGVAADLAKDFLAGDGAKAGAARRDRFERAILDAVPDAVVNSAGAPRLWNTSNIGFPPLQAEALLIWLSERGLFAAAGAACSSGSIEPSPVLLAQGIAEAVAHGSVRFSLSRCTTDAEIDRAIDLVPQAVTKLRGAMV